MESLWIGSCFRHAVPVGVDETLCWIDEPSSRGNTLIKPISRDVIPLQYTSSKNDYYVNIWNKRWMFIFEEWKKYISKLISSFKSFASNGC